ncbi:MULTISPECIES: hypothetical protein [Bacillaceae]|uniref:hypothetical protein n=1 Tax=Bacillaceae TaxID=186817 RepID=UPI000BECF547|nr:MULTISPECIES: hypothetical protein [unclassified Bacillus (in: firmicutes)]PEC48878.1 hypothetical protein CON00_14985 [Bacillus sp. AFS096315]PFM82898.1 hypothetical protein COJ46_03560 [Bacillus sp. AFS077874]
MISKKSIYVYLIYAVSFAISYFLVRVFIFHGEINSAFAGSIAGGFIGFLISIIFAKPIERR